MNTETRRLRALARETDKWEQLVARFERELQRVLDELRSVGFRSEALVRDKTIEFEKTYEEVIGGKRKSSTHEVKGWLITNTIYEQFAIIPEKSAMSQINFFERPRRVTRYFSGSTIICKEFRHETEDERVRRLARHPGLKTLKYETLDAIVCDLMKFKPRTWWS